MSALELGFVHRFERGSGKPTLLLLHGTGGNEDDLIELGRALAPDASLLSPRGKVMENGMPRFFRRLSEGVFDVADLQFRSRELADFVRAASFKYSFDLKLVVPVGYSNGANVAAGMLLTGAFIPSEAVLFRPMAPFTPDPLPDLRGGAVFISAGRSDRTVPNGSTQALAALLGAAGANVTLNWEDSSHELAEREIRTAAGWLRRIFTVGIRELG